MHLNISNAPLCETIDEAIAAAEKAAEWARFHIEQRGRENGSLRDCIEKRVEREKVFVRFFDDVNLILAGSRDTLCGSKWINAASLLEARNRYAKAMEEL